MSQIDIQNSETERKKNDETMNTSDERVASGRRFLKLLPGMAWNPLLGLPRNSPCPCGSGLKFKKCHLSKLPMAVPKKVADLWKKIIATHKQIRFVTDDKQKSGEQDVSQANQPADGREVANIHSG
jgi:hypothetical protein